VGWKGRGGCGGATPSTIAEPEAGAGPGCARCARKARKPSRIRFIMERSDAKPLILLGRVRWDMHEMHGSPRPGCAGFACWLQRSGVVCEAAGRAAAPGLRGTPSLASVML